MRTLCLVSKEELLVKINVKSVEAAAESGKPLQLVLLLSLASSEVPLVGEQGHLVVGVVVTDFEAFIKVRLHN